MATPYPQLAKSDQVSAKACSISIFEAWVRSARTYPERIFDF